MSPVCVFCACFSCQGGPVAGTWGASQAALREAPGGEEEKAGGAAGKGGTKTSRCGGETAAKTGRGPGTFFFFFLRILHNKEQCFISGTAAHVGRIHSLVTSLHRTKGCPMSWAQCMLHLHVEQIPRILCTVGKLDRKTKRAELGNFTDWRLCFLKKIPTAIICVTSETVKIL